MKSCLLVVNTCRRIWLNKGITSIKLIKMYSILYCMFVCFTAIVSFLGSCTMLQFFVYAPACTGSDCWGVFFRLGEHPLPM